ncbi:MAG: GNAT family N-acetyltransferase [Colwellia sp.]
MQYLNKNERIVWKTIKSLEVLIQLKYDWEELAQKKKDSLFVSPKWLIPWIQTYWQSNWSLNVITGYLDKKLVIIIPLYVQNSKNKLDCNKLFPLGQGEQELSEVSSEYQDVLTSIPIKLIAEEVANQIKKINYDILNWRALLHSADWIKVTSYLKSSTTELIGQRYNIKSHNNIRPKLSKNNRQKWNKCLKLLDSTNAKFYWVKKNEYDYYWEILKTLHQERWKKKSQLGAFHSSSFNNFHRLYRNNDDILMSALFVNNQVIAVNYYLKNQDTMYFYQCGWHSEYTHFSPGFALHQWSINQSKTINYDFMMADLKSTYKSKFGCNEINGMYNSQHIKNQIKFLASKIFNKIYLG